MVLISLIFCLLWIRAASGELWCDEIWSLYLIKRQNSLSGILQLKHDNNHILNSIFLYIYQIINISSPFLLRLHSVGVSAGTFILLFIISKRHIGSTAALFSCTLFCLSYISMLLMTEARGYGLMIFWMTLSLWCFLEYKQNHKFIWRTVFAASEILAVLSHSSALFFLAMLAFADIINLFIEEKNHRNYSASYSGMFNQLFLDIIFLFWNLYWFSNF